MLMKMTNVSRLARLVLLATIATILNGCIASYRLNFNPQIYSISDAGLIGEWKVLNLCSMKLDTNSDTLLRIAWYDRNVNLYSLTLSGERVFSPRSFTARLLGVVVKGKGNSRYLLALPEGGHEFMAFEIVRQSGMLVLREVREDQLRQPSSLYVSKCPARVKDRSKDHSNVDLLFGGPWCTRIVNSHRELLAILGNKNNPKGGCQLTLMRVAK